MISTPRTHGSNNNSETHLSSMPVSPTGEGQEIPPTKSMHSGKKRVPWTLVNFWLDATMLVVFLALVLVSTIIRFVFPAATAASGWELWGYGVDAWMSTQFALVAIMTFAIVVHLMLHWSWVCGVFFGKLYKVDRSRLPDDGVRTIYGVGLMIVILNVMGLLIGLAALMVRSPL